jgi:predicted acylesterase/phospholipase RssA
MDIVGTSVGIVVGAAIAWYWGSDARKARANSDRLLQHQAETIQNLKGFLLAMKVWTMVNVKLVDDRLQYIKEQGERFARIEKGEE